MFVLTTNYTLVEMCVKHIVKRECVRSGLGGELRERGNPMNRQKKTPGHEDTGAL